MHTILGAGGPVANALTRELQAHNEIIRLVSRKPIAPVDKNTAWQKADLLNYDEVLAATKDSTVIYLCAGLVYDVKVWQEQWPIVMQNVINATKAAKARLIFFDNIYMYGLVDGPITEETPYKPVSEKGKVRAKIADMLMNEVKAGNLQASILRAADFYGTDSLNSSFDMMLLDKYAKNETAQWVGNPKKLHNYTYIPDTGKAMYLLGQKPESDNQVWHAPTAKPMLGKDFIDLAARIYNLKPKYMSITKIMLWVFGLFNKTVGGVVEMYYQYDHDYNFNSDKFEKAFNLKPTNYEDGIKTMSETLYKKK